MGDNQPRYSKEEHARRGQAAYERMRPSIEANNAGRIVAIDVDSDAFELGDTSLEATQKLLVQRPKAQVWCVRIGDRAVHHFGPRVRPARV